MTIEPMARRPGLHQRKSPSARRRAFHIVTASLGDRASRDTLAIPGEVVLGSPTGRDDPTYSRSAAAGAPSGWDGSYPTGSSDNLGRRPNRHFPRMASPGRQYLRSAWHLRRLRKGKLRPNWPPRLLFCASVSSRVHTLTDCGSLSEPSLKSVFIWASAKGAFRF